MCNNNKCKKIVYCPKKLIFIRRFENVKKTANTDSYSKIHKYWNNSLYLCIPKQCYILV